MLPDSPADLTVLLPQPGDFEGVRVMAEELDLGHLSVSDREDLKKVDID